MNGRFDKSYQCPSSAGAGGAAGVVPLASGAGGTSAGSAKLGQDDVMSTMAVRLAQDVFSLTSRNTSVVDRYRLGQITHRGDAEQCLRQIPLSRIYHKTTGLQLVMQLRVCQTDRQTVCA